MVGSFSIINESNDDNLNDENKNKYIPEIEDYLYKYLLDGTVSFKSKDIANLFKLDEKELEILKSIHFLLNENVKDLIKNIPYLFRNLSHSTNKKDLECRGIIKGSINWNKTIKIRYSKGFNDSSLFVCSPPLKHYDLIENRILKFILKKIIFHFEKNLTFFDLKQISNINFENLNKEYKSWYNQVEDIYKLSIQTMRNVYFNDIGDLDYVSAADLNKLYNHRNNLYHNVAKVFELYENIFIIENKNFLADLIRKQLIVASNNNTLFEVYVFFKLISTLDNISVNDSFKMGLFYRNDDNDPVNAELINGTKVKVYYQNVPEVFNDNSLYLLLTDNKQFRFSTAVRRPDLIVEIIKDNESYYRIIEVKNSSKDNYMRDSFYKVLGYYKDFEDISYVNNLPIVVVNWNGSEIDMEQSENIFNEKIIFFNKNEFIKYKFKLLR